MKVTQREGYTLISPDDDLSMLEIERIQSSFAAMEKKAGTRFALDLSGVSFVYSTGIGLFIACAKEARRAHCEFSIVNVEPAIRETLESVHITHFFATHATLEEFEQAGPKSGTTAAGTTLDISVSRRPPWAVVALRGSCYQREAYEMLRSTLADLKPRIRNIIFDLQEFDMFDTAGINVLVSFSNQIQDTPHVLAIANANPLLTDLFVDCGLSKYFTFCSSVDEAKKLLITEQ